MNKDRIIISKLKKRIKDINSDLRIEKDEKIKCYLRGKLRALEETIELLSE